MAASGPRGAQGGTPEETGRFRQRRRTRAAIVDATAALVRSGVTPSVGDIAEAADVSRRTVYAYFPTLEQLLLDATLGLLAQAPVDDAIDSADVGDDATERVAAMIRALDSMSSDTLPLGRSLIRLTVDAPRPTDGGTPIRGYRRIGWIERALDPLRESLEDGEFERLVSALAMVVGWEALIVLQDLRGLGDQERLDVSLWASGVLIRAALDDARSARPE
jgi:AcrR family transcriptional regulator